VVSTSTPSTDRHGYHDITENIVEYDIKHVFSSVYYNTTHVSTYT
jgi:hypothetical protein